MCCVFFFGRNQCFFFLVCMAVWQLSLQPCYWRAQLLSFLSCFLNQPWHWWHKAMIPISETVTHCRKKTTWKCETLGLHCWLLHQGYIAKSLRKLSKAMFESISKPRNIFLIPYAPVSNGQFIIILISYHYKIITHIISKSYPHVLKVLTLNKHWLWTYQKWIWPTV